jgi:hypothetical protein
MNLRVMTSGSRLPEENGGVLIGESGVRVRRSEVGNLVGVLPLHPPPSSLWRLDA